MSEVKEPKKKVLVVEEVEAVASDKI